MAFAYSSYNYAELLSMGLQQITPPPPPPPPGFPKNLVPQKYPKPHNSEKDSLEIDNSDDEESNGLDDNNKRTLFCANLDERVTEELLYEVFLQAGPIERAHIPKDANGRQRSFGFITYEHKCTIPYALQLYQGLSLFRKTLVIRCNKTTPQKRRVLSPSTERDMYKKSRNIDNNAFRSNTATTSNFNRYNAQSQYDRRPQRNEKRNDWTRGTTGRREFNFRRNSNSNSSNNDSNNHNRDKRSSSRRHDRNKRRAEDFQKHLSNSGRHSDKRYNTQHR